MIAKVYVARPCYMSDAEAQLVQSQLTLHLTEKFGGCTLYPGVLGSWKCPQDEGCIQDKVDVYEIVYQDLAIHGFTMRVEAFAHTAKVYYFQDEVLFTIEQDVVVRSV